MLDNTTIKLIVELHTNGKFKIKENKNIKCKYENGVYYINREFTSEQTAYDALSNILISLEFSDIDTFKKITPMFTPMLNMIKFGTGNHFLYSIENNKIEVFKKSSNIDIQELQQKTLEYSEFGLALVNYINENICNCPVRKYDKQDIKTFVVDWLNSHK